MKLRLIAGIQLVVFGLLMSCQCAKVAPAAKVNVVKQADVTGTWKSIIPGRNGQHRENTLKLAMVDGKLTGTVSGPRGGETAIEDAALTGDEITFTVTVHRNNRTFSYKCTGKVRGDTIKGTFERKNAQGQPQIGDWEAEKQ